MPDTLKRTVGVVGARGYVGDELVGLLAAHPVAQLTIACSTSKAGSEVLRAPHLRYIEPDPTAIATECPEILFLALPNGEANPFMDALEAAGGTPELVIDVSSDARFNDAWIYSLPELHAERVTNAQKISNPGCYATAMQLALAPINDRLVGVPHCFGVSGYSGAGATPSPKNDTERLADGLLPYALNGHLHEREVSRHLGTPVRFAPCVAPYFRGIVLTALCELDSPISEHELVDLYANRYEETPLINSIGTAMPRVQEIVGTHRAEVGGVGVDLQNPHRISVVCVIDNLLKGAASQAIQNFNIASGIHPEAGLSA